MWCVCFLSHPFLDCHSSVVICCHLVTLTADYSKHFFVCVIKETTLSQIGGVFYTTRLFAKHSIKFRSFCVLETGVNLLVGTESGLMLLDRSGQGKVYPLINRRRFQQMDVLEGLNVLLTMSGKKDKSVVYY